MFPDKFDTHRHMFQEQSMHMQSIHKCKSNAAYIIYTEVDKRMTVSSNEWIKGRQHE